MGNKTPFEQMQETVAALVESVYALKSAVHRDNDNKVSPAECAELDLESEIRWMRTRVAHLEGWREGALDAMRALGSKYAQ